MRLRLRKKVQTPLLPADENSGDANNDGMASVTLPIDCPLYDATLGATKLGLYTGSDEKKYAMYNNSCLMAYALTALEDKIDFASYDRDQNGRIDPTELAFLLVFPGTDPSRCGDEAVNGKPGIWPHSWLVNNSYGENIESALNQMVMVDNVAMYKYTIIAENQNKDYSYLDS